MGFIKIIGHLSLVLLLTVLTQVGGIIWVLALVFSVKFKKKKRYIFPILYVTFNLVIIPPIAKVYGREALPVFSDELKPRNWLYPLLFRNYVNPILKVELEDSAHILSFSNISITYLDANFPFFDGFPLLPHLSHNDGEKIDISFMYLNDIGTSTKKKPSVSGYGVYANSEANYTSESCLYKGYWQYNFSKYLTFGTVHNLTLDKRKTKLLILQLLSINETQKMFLEPHLKQSLSLNSQTKIKFHGCQAVRHDDHIHLQMK